MTVNLAEKYIPLLDEKYSQETVTAILDAPAEMVREGRQADTVYIPEMILEGLADYDRSSGFNTGSVTLNWNAHTFTQDRGREFLIDAMDEQESMEVMLANIVGEFIRNQVAPEIDAYRFEQMTDKAGNTVNENSLDASDTLESIDTAHETLDDAEVPSEGRILYLNPEIFKYLKQSDLIERMFDVGDNDNALGRNIYNLEGTPVIKAPKSRMNDSVTIDAGGGFTLAGDTLNYVLVHEDAVAPIAKHAQPRIFDPETYQDAHAWKFDYRIYHDIFVLGQKTDGIYVSIDAA